MQYASDQNNTPLEDYQVQGKECQSLHRDQFHPATVDAGVLGSYRQAIKSSYHRKHPNVHEQSLQSSIRGCKIFFLEGSCPKRMVRLLRLDQLEPAILNSLQMSHFQEEEDRANDSISLPPRVIILSPRWRIYFQFFILIFGIGQFLSALGLSFAIFFSFHPALITIAGWVYVASWLGYIAASFLLFRGYTHFAIQVCHFLTLITALILMGCWLITMILGEGDAITLISLFALFFFTVTQSFTTWFVLRPGGSKDSLTSRVEMESNDRQDDTRPCCGSVIAATVECGMAIGSLLLLLTGSNVIYYWLGRIPFIPLAIMSPLIFFFVSVISVVKLDQFIRDIRSLG